jgi:hypothetical protein
MSTSLRRREGRLALGANKKIKAYSAEGGITVGVMWFSISPLSHRPLKASKGVEKSCFKKRRKRGLRKGKSRSRGRHPRRTTPPATSSTHTTRSVTHHLRFVTWAESVATRFGNRVKKSYETGRFDPKPGGSRTVRPLYASFKAHWKRKHSMIAYKGGGAGKLLADTVLRNHFNSFIEPWCRVRMDEARKGEPNVHNDVAGFMAALGRSLPPPNRNRPIGDALGSECACKFVMGSPGCAVCRTPPKSVRTSRSNSDNFSGRSGGVTPTRKRGIAYRVRRPKT